MSDSFAIVSSSVAENVSCMVLDTFTLAGPARTLNLNPSEVERLHATVERVLAGKVDSKDLLRNRPKPVRPSRKAGIVPHVVFDSEASGTAGRWESSTIATVIAEQIVARKPAHTDPNHPVQDRWCSTILPPPSTKRL